MAITITHLDGPLAGQVPLTFGDSQTDIMFGRSREADVVYPEGCGTVGSKDIQLVRTRAGTYEIRRSGQHYLEIDGRPVAVDLNNIPVVSDSVVRLGGKDGPSFRIQIEKQQKGPVRTAITQPYEIIKPMGQQLGD